MGLAYNHSLQQAWVPRLPTRSCKIIAWENRCLGAAADSKCCWQRHNLQTIQIKQIWKWISRCSSQRSSTKVASAIHQISKQRWAEHTSQHIRRPNSNITALSQQLRMAEVKTRWFSIRIWKLVLMELAQYHQRQPATTAWARLLSMRLQWNIKIKAWTAELIWAWWITRDKLPIMLARSQDSFPRLRIWEWRAQKDRLSTEDKGQYNP